MHCSTRVRLSVVQNNYGESGLACCLTELLRAAKGLNDSEGQIIAIWANEGMGMVTTTYL
jgi:hypothetical protein